MTNNLFKTAEKASKGTTFALDAIKNSLKFNKEGLIPAIAQQQETGEVLMMAWMNITAFDETLETGRVCYWSRSRQQLWRKGELSGQIQVLREMRVDCDGDTLLLLVDQTGPACHTGRKSCFFHTIREGQCEITTDPIIDPKTLYGSK